MSEHEMPDAGAAARPATTRLPVPTIAEGWALAVAALSLLILYGSNGMASEVGRDFVANPAAAAWLFMPHLILIAVIISGLRPLAALLQAFILTLACLIGLGAWVSSIGSSHSSDGVGVFVALQIVLMVLCQRNARQRLRMEELARLGPRIALGALFGTVGWLGATTAALKVTAPERARASAAAAAKRQESARRDARRLVATIATCMQSVPVTPDSQPIFPATLSELPAANCPEAALPAPPGFVVEYEAGGVDSTGSHRTFTLRMREEPASDTSRAYEIDQSMMLRQLNGRLFPRTFSSGGSAVVSNLVQVGSCIERARSAPAVDERTTYPRSLADLQIREDCGLRLTADSSMATVSTEGGYATVRYTAPTAPRPRGAVGGYTLSLEPSRDRLGRATGGFPASFFSDTTGTIHMTLRARTATAADPAIPDCSTQSSSGGAAVCSPYRARQRWGVEPEMPMITGWSRSGNGTFGIGETLYLIPQYHAVAERDTAVEAQVQWEMNAPVSTVPRHKGALGESFGSGTNFRLQHAYADTGTKVIAFWIRTASGERYSMRDSVHVVSDRRR